ncbi:P-loop NTPase fold protein [Exiguobacterium sp. s166]|uniref:P-loop NTPase fold protein n=1 Tax=Exiguobacterium sp. s166 TaxID=2751204 RepID=UPI001BE5DBDB|nr:P-loop NTPase fold protein [Exiguobacterium sp. s166]
MFNEQINKINKLILLNKSNEESSCLENDDKFNRLIGIAGERGSGKSSLLKTLKFQLEKKTDYDNYLVLPIIDPNKIDTQMGILEIILSNLYLAVEKMREKSYESINEFNEISRKIVSQLGIVSKLSFSKSDFRKNFSNEEILNQYHKRLLFEDDFHSLFADVWSILKEKPKKNYRRGYLVILIDDIDLVDNSLVYKMLEDVKSVLSNNVTVIVTYRHTQLLNSVYDSKIQENNNLLVYKIIDDSEIRLQTATYIEKMFMQNNIIKMPIKEEVIYLPLKKFFSDVELKLLVENGFVLQNSIIKNIYDVIKRKTLIDIYSLDINERTLYESNLTLRGIVQILEFLYEDLEDIVKPYGEKKLNKKYLETNLKKLKSYFLSVSEQLLDVTEKKILEKWDLVDEQSKNYIVYKELYIQLMAQKDFNSDTNISQEEFGNLLAINRIEAYNVCLGDVIEIFNVYKDNISSNLSKYHFIYTLKILYSIELLTSLLIEIFYEDDNQYNTFFELSDESNYYFKSRDNNLSKKNMYWYTKYYHLTRYKIIPENITWLSKKSDVLKIKYIQFINNNDSEVKIYKFLDKILYTSVSTFGDVKGTSRIRVRDLNSSSYLLTQDPHRYRYRYNFLFRFNSDSKLHESDEIRNNELTSFRKSDYYSFDPYSYLVKENYLSNVIYHYNYLFYSLFDIDIILTKNHDSKSKNKSAYVNLFSSVNEIYSEILQNEEYNLGKFISSNKSKEVSIYSEYDLEYLDEYTIVEEKEAQDKNNLKLSRSELRLLQYDIEKEDLSKSSVRRKKDFIMYAKSIPISKNSRSEFYYDIKVILETENKEDAIPTEREQLAMKRIIQRIRKKLNGTN